MQNGQYEIKSVNLCAWLVANMLMGLWSYCLCAPATSLAFCCCQNAKFNVITVSVSAAGLMWTYSVFIDCAFVCLIQTTKRSGCEQCNVLWAPVQDSLALKVHCLVCSIAASSLGGFCCYDYCKPLIKPKYFIIYWHRKCRKNKNKNSSGCLFMLFLIDLGLRFVDNFFHTFFYVN